MKILYHHRIASKDGQYVHIEEINKSLKKAGHDIVLVAPSMGEEQEFGGDGGLVSKLKSKLPKFIYELVEFAYSFWAFIKLSVAIIRHKPAFIYERYNLFNPSGVWAKKLFGLPLLLEINAPIFEERGKYDGISLKKLAKWTEEYTWKNADIVLPVTDVLADYQRAIGIVEERIRVIPNGINVDAFMTGNLPNHLKQDTSEFVVIGFVGFCREWHGLDKIVQLLTEPGNENLFFLLVGDGPAVPGIKKIAEDNNLMDRIHITGLVGRDDMPGWLTPMDIALQPAVVDYASPLKMLEYMATAKGIVAPDQPNIRELLTHDENALLFNPQDQQSFIDACKTLAQNTELRERLANNARDAISKHNLTWDYNAQVIVALAKQVLNEKKGGNYA